MSQQATYKFSPLPKVAFEDDFLKVSVSATDNTNAWFATVNTQGTALLVDDYPGGALAITTHTTQYHTVNLQAPGGAFKLALGKPLVLRVSGIKITDADAGQFFVGLCRADTAILNASGSGAAATTDAIGFVWDGTDLNAVCAKDETTAWSQDIDTGGTLTDAANVDLAMTFDGAGTIKWYLNGDEVASLTDSAATVTEYPDDEALTPSIEVQNLSGSAATAVVTVDYYGIEQTR